MQKMTPRLNKSTRKGLKSFAVPKAVRLSEWAAEHFYLSAESSYVEKRWEAYPYQIAILDCMGHDEIEEINFPKSARVGYTKMLLAASFYFAEHKRRNQAIWQPTDEDADDFVKTELDTALRDVEVMQSVFPAYHSRDKNNTLRQKKFLGSVLHIRGGKAAKNYRRISVDVAILDELDGFDNDIEKEGAPDLLAKKRTEGATFPKLIRGSTPKLKHLSMVESAERNSLSRFRYHIPCPDCGDYHQLTFKPNEAGQGGIRWHDNDPETVKHFCPGCGLGYTQIDYLRVWQQGRWIDQHGNYIDQGCVFRDTQGNPIQPPRTVGFHIWTAYSPQATWVSIAYAFIKASTKAERGDKSELKTFINTTLGESWEEDVEKTDEDALKQRAEAYPLRQVPYGGLILTAGVDVQDNRFEVTVYAFGVGEEMWTIDYVVLDANPAVKEDWEKLDAYLSTSFQHVSGVHLRIEAAAIDTGGHFTHEVYEFCRHRSHRKIFAIKGESKPGMPIKGRCSKQDVKTKTGKIVKNGIKLWGVGTDTAKDLIYGRLQVPHPGPGYIHFSKDLPDKFYDQLTAEVRVLTRSTAGEVYRWVRQRTRNEVLDCTVYAIFAAYALDLHRYTDKMWQRLIDIVQPANADLFAASVEVPDEVKALPAPVIVQATSGGKISLKGTRYER